MTRHVHADLLAMYAADTSLPVEKECVSGWEYAYWVDVFRLVGGPHRRYRIANRPETESPPRKRTVILPEAEIPAALTELPSEGNVWSWGAAFVRQMEPCPAPFDSVTAEAWLAQSRAYATEADAQAVINAMLRRVER